MATAAEFLSACAAEVGHSRWNDEDAEMVGTRYGRDYATRHGAVFGQNGVPFCDMGMTYCLRKVGVTDFDSAYVPARVSTARARGWLVPYGSARPGDMVTFDWDDDGEDDHIGAVESTDSTGVNTIEFNTSDESNGNGGQVLRRHRPWAHLSHCIRYPWTDSGVGSIIPAERRLEDVQRAVGAYPDHVIGPDTRKRLLAVVSASQWGGASFPFGVQYVQGVIGTEQDGVWGEVSAAAHDRTVEAVQRALGVEDDGVWGPDTQAAWQALSDASEQV